VFCFIFTAFAQNAPVKSMTVMLPPYSIHMLENLNSDRDKFIVTLLFTDMNQSSGRVKLRLRMDGFSHALQTRRNAITTIYDLTPGVPLRLTNRDLEDYFLKDNLEFTNINPTYYSNNKTVPEDRYTIYF
jgi:hypothetical protein